MTSTGCCAKSKSFRFGCTEPCRPEIVTRTVYVKQKIPERLLELPELPTPPDRNATKMQSDVQPYYIDMAVQYKILRGNVKKISDLVEIEK